MRRQRDGHAEIGEDSAGSRRECECPAAWRLDPLHAAAQNGDVEMARALIAGGADVEARADNNQNALDLALTKGQQAMVDFLETNGARL